jgi:hypothetical protein
MGSASVFQMASAPGTETGRPVFAQFWPFSSRSDVEESAASCHEAPTFRDYGRLLFFHWTQANRMGTFFPLLPNAPM